MNETKTDDKSPVTEFQNKVKQLSRDFTKKHVKNPGRAEYLLIENAMIIGVNLGLETAIQRTEVISPAITK